MALMVWMERTHTTQIRARLPLALQPDTRGHRRLAPPTEIDQADGQVLQVVLSAGRHDSAEHGGQVDLAGFQG